MPVVRTNSLLPTVIARSGIVMARCGKLLLLGEEELRCRRRLPSSSFVAMNYMRRRPSNMEMMGRFRETTNNLSDYVDENFHVVAPKKYTKRAKIVAGGRGKAITLAPVHEKILELAGKRKPNVLYIGTPSFDRDGPFRVQTVTFRKSGCPVRRLLLASDDASSIPSETHMRHLIVEWADVVQVSGGNTLYALLRWRDLGVDTMLKEAASKGTVFCGGSAGAGCWFSSLHTDSLRPDLVNDPVPELSEEEKEDWEYARISGMGYIDAMCVPHYDTTGTNGNARSEDSAEFVLEQPDTVSIGIDENAALVVDGGKATVISGDGIAKVYKVVATENGETKETPIEPSSDPIPLKELLEVPSN